MSQLIILLLSFLPFHDVAMANFEISQEDDHLSLFIKMDKEDLESLYSKNIDLTQKKETIQKYLDEHFYLVINNQYINFKIQDISKDDLFYSIELSSQNNIDKTINIIQLKNTCLVDKIDNHSNIINFQINGKFRTFRMHDARTRIDVKY